MANDKHVLQLRKVFTVNVISLLPSSEHWKITKNIDSLFKTVYQQKLQDTLQCRGLYGTGTVTLTIDYKLIRAKYSPTLRYSSVSEEPDTSSTEDIGLSEKRLSVARTSSDIAGYSDETDIIRVRRLRDIKLGSTKNQNSLESTDQNCSFFSDRNGQQRSLESLPESLVKEKCLVIPSDDVDYDFLAYTYLQQAISYGDAFIILYESASVDTAVEIRDAIHEEERKMFVPIVLEEVDQESTDKTGCSACDCQLKSSASCLWDAFERLLSIVKEEAGFIAPPKPARRVTRVSVFGRIRKAVTRRFSLQ